MTTLMLELPLPVEQSELELKKMCVAKLYEEGVMSPGQGATMLGMAYRDFVDEFGFYFRMTPEELDKEMEILNQVVDMDAVYQRMAAWTSKYA